MFDWKRWPQTEAFVNGLVETALAGNGFAASLASRMRDETGTRFVDWLEPFPSDLAREGRMTPQAARDALAARDLWQSRRRRFDEDEEGFDATEALLRRVVERAGGPDLACHLVFECERDYWESRNRAAR